MRVSGADAAPTLYSSIAIFTSRCSFLSARATLSAAPLFRFENRRENAGAFRLIPEITLLSTKENYDATGTKIIPVGTDSVNGTSQQLTSYSRTQIDLFGIYGLTPKLTLFGRLSLSTSKFETATDTTAANEGDPDGSGVEGLQGSASGLADQAIGANYRLLEFGTKSAGQRTSSLDLQFELGFPMYNTKKNREEEKPLQGDGTTDITVSPFVTIPLNQGAGSRIYALGGLGLTTRSGGYSAVIPYQAQVVMLPERDGLMLRGGLYGYKAMKSDGGLVGADADAGFEGAPGASVRDAGGSAIVNAKNSSYTAFRLTAGYQTTANSQYYVGYTTLIAGKSTAALTALHFGAQFRWAGRGGGGARPGVARGRSGTRASGPARYDLQGQVTQVAASNKAAQINRGAGQGMATGQTVDFFRVDGGRPVLVARGTVTQVAAGAANVAIRAFYQQVVLQKGFIARRIAQ